MSITRKLGQGIGYIIFAPVVIFIILMAVILYIITYEDEQYDG